MRFKQFKRLATCASLSTVLIATAGCEINERDVTAARDNVVEERQETEQTRREAAQKIMDKEKELADARHSAKKVPYDEQGNVREKQEELENTREEAREDVKQEEQETREAEMEAKRMESELAAKNARDALVASANQKLEAVDQRIDAMKTQLEQLEGAEHEKLATDLAQLQTDRKALADAIDEVNDVEVLQWETKKPLVEKAIQRIDENKSIDG
jgi:chromosome segregation ATPase